MIRRGNNNFFLVWTSRINLSGGRSFQFWLKFSNFKGVSPRNKWRNPKKIKKISILVVWWRMVYRYFTQYKHHENIWVVVEVFTFWSKFSNFTGVSPRNKWQNPKNDQFLILVVWWREVIINFSQYKLH